MKANWLFCGAKCYILIVGRNFNIQILGIFRPIVIRKQYLCT